MACAALAALCGCTSLDDKVGLRWKIEPSYDVHHTMQSSEAYYTLGRYFDGSQNWDKSIDAYRKAIAADAGNVEAYNALGVALSRIGRHADAEITLRQAVALAPAQAHILNNLGYALLLGGKTEEAIAALRMAVSRDAGNAGAAANLQLAQDRAAIPAAVATAGVAAPAAAAPAEPSAPPAAAGDTGVPVGAAAGRAAATLQAGFEAPAPAPESVISPAATTSAPTPPTAPKVSADEPASARLEISNGNGMPGMAAQVGRWLAARGMRIEHLSNQRPYTQRHTIVQYRAGFLEAAQRVAQAMPADAQPDAGPTAGLRGDVRVLLGHDARSSAACLARKSCRPAAVSVAAARP